MGYRSERRLGKGVGGSGLALLREDTEAHAQCCEPQESPLQSHAQPWPPSEITVEGVEAGGREGCSGPDWLTDPSLTCHGAARAFCPLCTCSAQQLGTDGQLLFCCCEKQQSLGIWMKHKKEGPESLAFTLPLLIAGLKVHWRL